MCVRVTIYCVSLFTCVTIYCVTKVVTYNREYEIEDYGSTNDFEQLCTFL